MSPSREGALVVGNMELHVQESWTLLGHEKLDGSRFNGVKEHLSWRSASLTLPHVSQLSTTDARSCCADLFVYVGCRS